MTSDRQSSQTCCGIAFVVLAVLALPAGSALGQATNQITAIDPDSAVQGTIDLLVTFTLDTDDPPAPPAGVMPDSVMVGSISGTSVTHSSQYIITAVFAIPGSEPVGAKDAVITFSPPEGGTLTFSMTDGFTVTAGEDTPPTIAQHPQSQTAPPGSSVTFTVVAYGTEPLSYQWQKDGGDITGATDTSYTINPVDWDDAGNYRCLVENDFGTATSDEAVLTVAELPTGAYPVVDTAQELCYDDSFAITCPSAGQAFYGQDAQLDGLQPSYAISGDGLTVYDNVTGLTWTRDADLDTDGDIDVDDKLTFDEAPLYADTLNAQNYGGYNDWRVPSIKELYSLMDFRGTDPSVEGTYPSGLTPFIDTDYFEFAYGDLAAGERIIDSQWVTTTLYLDTVMDGQQAMFGVNFADGRIKGYGLGGAGGGKTFYVRLCRGNTDYGVNNFTDNGDGTITDLATGLMWSQDDSGDGIDTGPRSGMIWEDALAWAQQKNAENYLGHDDWRLPNAKELQSIVDYSRAPGATGSGAIDPVFNITQITNEDGEVDYPWFWTGTTHVREGGSGESGAYICFGRGMGYWSSQWQDVHGAGCQRSDRKNGDFAGYTYVYDGYFFGMAPQGDAARMYNYVRLVRDVGPAQTIVSAASVLDHGGTYLALDLTANDVEPRLAGVLMVEVEASGPVSSVSADVSCVNSTYEGTITATADGTTITVEFDEALPDQDCCEITLSGDVSGAVQVRPLAGDVDRSGLVTTGDASIIKPYFGDTPTDADAQFDVDCSGLISTGDFSQVKPKFGHSAPTCP